MVPHGGSNGSKWGPSLYGHFSGGNKLKLKNRNLLKFTVYVVSLVYFHKNIKMGSLLAVLALKFALCIW